MFTIFLAVFLNATTANNSAYQEIFSEDYSKALKFEKSNNLAFELISQRFNVEARFLKSIVFPELIRYSYFSNMFETAALEWLYVTGGSKSADFSVGYFQMKPSFVEKLEVYVSSEESLRSEYGFITYYDSGSPIRNQRLKRLKNPLWQLVFLSCFFESAQHKFKSEKFDSDIDRLKFFCVVYNAGLSLEASEIRKRTELKNFPYGAKFGNDQYSYSDIAVDYYIRYSAE